MKRKGKSSVENKIERKTIEKDRRIRMKALCLKLVSLIPDNHFTAPKEYLSHQDQIKEAAAYIKILRGRIEELERRKREAVMKKNGVMNNNTASFGKSSELPILRIKDLGCEVEVVLITGQNKKFSWHKIISILEDGGAQVVSVNISTVGEKILHSLHAQVMFSRVGVDTSRITARIHESIF